MFLKLSKEHAMIIIYESCFVEKSQIFKPLAGHFYFTWKRNKTRISSELTRLLMKSEIKKPVDLINKVEDMNRSFKFIRINTLKVKFKEGLIHIKSLIEEPDAVEIDDLIENLIRIPTCHVKTVCASSIYDDRQIIIQDKASCFPAVMLSPSPGSVGIDATAAPGNKTSHLVALMQNRGTVYAFDRDQKRLNTLKDLTTRANCTIIKPFNRDWLTVSADEFPNAEWILLDPSCSGSGHRQNTAEESIDESNAASEQRLTDLSYFQTKALIHAFSNFPTVKKIVYSTCSLYEAENERVVQSALDAAGLENGFRIETALPQWHRRGLPLFPDAEKLVRCDGREDGTLGFFAALFVRD